MNSLDRRMFLTQAAAVPLVFGLAEFDTQQEAKDSEPEWFPRALARMKETGRWGLVLTLPHPDLRFQRGMALWSFMAFEDEDVDAHEIFCEAVVMVLTPEFIRKRFLVREQVDRLVLSPEGAFLTGDRIDDDVFKESKRFAESFRKFLHGDTNERLAERAKAIEAGMPAELKQAAGRLGAESVDERTAAAAALARKVEALTPYLAWLEHGASDDRRRRQARSLLSSYFATLRFETGSKLPYGCLAPRHHDPCPGCGMMRRSARSSMFLQFQAPGEPPPKKRRGEDD